ncbi:MAG: hypothetical protein HQ507_05375 [Candidatus Marinimicrobia bacterium]|nr:hypothetical protein [Candidatus Neomarinimicrobiota bacterium]
MSMTQRTILATTLLLICANTVTGQIQYSGFADIVYTKELTEDGEAAFGYGQFELDLSAIVSPRVTFEGAIAYNADDGLFEAGAGFLDIHLTGSDEAHPPRGGYIQHSGLMVGQFDVPFGLDYLYIPSPDRKLVSAPLLNQKTIDSWNDMGLNLYCELSFLNFNYFIVNGAQAGIATGGRAVIPLANILEIGASFATQTADNDSGAVPNIIGVDFQSAFGPLEARFEYQQATAVLEGDFDNSGADDQHSGYYAQLDLDMEQIVNLPVFLSVRYGVWEKDTETAKRLTAGLGYKISEGFECRAEYLSNWVNENDPDNQIVIQTVVSF